MQILTCLTVLCYIVLPHADSAEANVEIQTRQVKASLTLWHACQVAPGKEAAAEAPDAELKPQNNTERDINLNLAVALRMIEERG